MGYVGIVNLNKEIDSQIVKLFKKDQVNDYKVWQVKKRFYSETK